MTIKEARILIVNELKIIYDLNESNNIAELILEKICGLEKSKQLLKKDFFLNPGQLYEIKKMLARLKENEPIQYVLGEAWFAGIKFKVNKNVLIPRPETEELVDWVVKEAICSEQQAMSILDVGTGSGCIPIAIKKELPQINMQTIDICSEAIFTATENAIAHDTEIEFLVLDFLNEEKWHELGKFDIIVSNPPYVLQKEKETLHTRVFLHEPSLALFVPDNDGLIFYEKLADFSLSHLNPNGKLFIEINESLGKEVVELFLSKGFKTVELRKDMQGKDRMVRGVLSY